MRTVLPRQKRNFTCGIGAMAAAAQILKLFFPRGTMLSAIGAKPDTGTSNDAMEKWAKEQMPVHSAGCNTYHGGLAVANIQNQHSHIGHYVVFLGEKKGVIRYYCPLLGQIFEEKRENIIWKNSTGKVKNWSINFHSDEDFYDLECEPERHIFILGDNKDGIKNPSAQLIQSAYESREQSVSYHTADSIFTKGRHLFLSGVPVLSNDIVWFRCDPRNTAHYYDLLRRLCAVDATIINAPQAILTFHDKLAVNKLNPVYQYTVSSEDNLKRSFNHLRAAGYTMFLIKDPSDFTGQNAESASDIDTLRTLMKKYSQTSGYVILEGLKKAKNKAETLKILVTSNKVLGALNHKQQHVDLLNDAQKKLVKDTQDLMKEHNIFWAELSIENDVLREVNTTCMLSLQNLNEAESSHIEYDLIDACHEWLEDEKKSKIKKDAVDDLAIAVTTKSAKV